MTSQFSVFERDLLNEWHLAINALMQRLNIKRDISQAARLISLGKLFVAISQEKAAYHKQAYEAAAQTALLRTLFPETAWGPDEEREMCLLQEFSYCNEQSYFNTIQEGIYPFQEQMQFGERMRTQGDNLGINDTLQLLRASNGEFFTTAFHEKSTLISNPSGAYPRDIPARIPLPGKSGRRARLWVHPLSHNRGVLQGVYRKGGAFKLIYPGGEPVWVSPPTAGTKFDFDTWVLCAENEDLNPLHLFYDVKLVSETVKKQVEDRLRELAHKP